MVTTPRPYRILVGCFFLEANSFASGATTLDDFAVAGLTFGDDVRRETLPPGSEFAAAWDTLVTAGAQPVPTVFAWSSPRPPMTRVAFDTILEAILSRANDAIDGAFLSLHGSALAAGEDDPEGAVLAALRARLGPGRPIAISLDCHANLTRRMAENADIIAAYRTCPHTDLARTGAQAARILVSTLNGQVRPVVAVERRPMITPADLMDSSRDPFRSLMALCDAAERRPGVLAAAFLPCQPWLDVADLGWRAAVTVDGDRGLAAAEAGGIADAMWRARWTFMGGARQPAAAALAQALAGPAPYVVADAGDATNGGSRGDSTELLRAALGHSRRRIWLTLLDAAAARAARSAGHGSTLALDLGSGAPGAYNERVRVTATVMATPEGAFAYTHPFAAGLRGDLGAAAVLAIGEIRVVAHAHEVIVIDPQPYVAAGLDPRDAEVLQAKSQVSYRAGFAAVTPRSVVADTDGPTTASLPRLPYMKRPRPLFPFEDA